MQPSSVFKVDYLTGKIRVLQIILKTDNLDGVVLSDTEVIGITAKRHLSVPHTTHIDEPLEYVTKTLYLNKSVIDELFKTNKRYVGFEDGLNYEFYNLAKDIPNPCV